MIPVADCVVHIDVNLATLFTPDADTVGYPGWLGIIHEHSGYLWHAAEWQFAADLLEREWEATDARDRRAATAQEFEGLLDELCDDDLLASSMCDFGIGAATWALNAAGYVTGSCCSGHVDGGPNILLACDTDRALELVRIANESACGLESLRGGLQLWAPSIKEMLELAANLIARQETFAAMPLPAPRLDGSLLDDQGRRYDEEE